MIWARMLAYITGTVDQELLLRNEYLAAENRILRAQIKGRLLLSDAEKTTLAEIAHRFKRKALEELAAVAKPDTLLAWYRKLIANKFDGSKFRKSYASHPTTGNWRHEDFHLARFAALSAAPYGPVLLRRPFGFHLAMDTLPSELQQAVASGRSWLCPASPSCPFRRLHTFRFLRPARLITPLLDMAPLI